MMKHNSVRGPRIVQSNLYSRLMPAAIIVVALLLIVCAVIYWYPDSPPPACEPSAAPEPIVDTSRINQLEEKVSALEKERDEYRLQAAQFERASQIDQQVVSTVRADLKKLQEERAELRQQVEFLKSLVSGDITSIQLSDFKIVKTADKNKYRYALTVSKRAKEKGRVQGNLSFSIKGTQGGKKKELDADDLSINTKRLLMNFQNFQKYKGTLELPGNFRPKSFKIKVKPNGDKFKAFEREFPWRLTD